MSRLYYRPRQTLDYGWAALTIGLAIVALRGTSEDFDITAALYLAIQLLTAFLFVIRRPAIAWLTNKWSYAVAVSSMLYVYLYEFERAGGEDLSAVGQGLLILGALGCLAATLSLGDCFGVLPICRGVRTSGLYRVVRHPIYASYILMDTGMVVSYPTPWNMILFACAIALFLWRIELEELVLRQFATYCEYARNVPRRLIPLVY